MAGLTSALIGSIASPIVGGLVGQAAGAGQRDASERAYQQALQQLAGIRIPTIEEQQINLLAPQLAGEYQAIQQQAAQELGPTALSNIQIDPKLREAQMKALSSLAELGEGGLNAVDRAMLDQINREQAAQTRANQAGILQNLAARGMAGGGQELALKLAAGQQSADRAAQQGQQLQAMALQRSLDAISKAGQLGGQVRQQEFGEQSEAARAQDVINQFNLQNQQRVLENNLAEQRRAQATNLGERQRIQDMATQLRNQQETANKGLIQQQFQNQLQRAGGMASQLNRAGERMAQQAQDTGGMYGRIGSAVGSGFANYGQQLREDEQNKQFMDALQKLRK